MARRSASSTAAARVRTSSPRRAPCGSIWTSAPRSSAFGDERRRLLDHVLELADVAGPGVLDEARHRLGRERLRRAGAPGEAGEEVRGEERDVLAALAQRRDPDRHHGEPVVEVLAEAALGDRAAQVLVRRRDDPHVDLDRRRLADPPDLALLERAQELRLEPRARLADLVDEERAAVGLLEEPAPRARRAR